MDTHRVPKQRVVVPKYHASLGILVFILSFICLVLLDARASDFGTISSALGLYSAALLGVFSILNAWQSAITQRRPRYLHVENDWKIVIDRSVKFALNGSALSFLLMLFGVIAPAVKEQIAYYLGTELYSWAARLTSSLAISGVIILGMMSLQIVRDITAVYKWNNSVEEQEAEVRAQREALE